MKKLSKKDIKDLVDSGVLIPLHPIKDREIINIVKKLSQEILERVKARSVKNDF